MSCDGLWPVCKGLYLVPVPVHHAFLFSSLEVYPVFSQDVESILLKKCLNNRKPMPINLFLQISFTNSLQLGHNPGSK